MSKEDLRKLSEMREEIEKMNRKIDALMDKYKVEVRETNRWKDKSEIEKEQIITKYLLDLGMKANLQGFKYTRVAIMKILDKNSYSMHVTKELYPEVAELLQTKGSNVERSIRHAIHCVYKSNPDNKILKEMLANNNGFCPTNAEFLSFLVEKIHLEEETY